MSKKSFIEKKDKSILASVIAQIIPSESFIRADYICKVVIKDEKLLLFRNEYLKDSILLYECGLDNIRDAMQLFNQQEIQSVVKSIFMNIFGVLALLLSGTGFIHNRKTYPDIFLIRFCDGNVLTFTVLEGSSKRLVNILNELVEETSPNN